MYLRDILNSLQIYQSSTSVGDIEIQGLKYDSRHVQVGDLFICIPGFKTDGHIYAKSAVEKGAVAILVERYLEECQNVPQIIVPDARDAMAKLAAYFYDYPSNKMGLIGITGTNGKTTTTYLIKHILEKNHVVGLIGTIGNLIGTKKLPAARTTPESVDLQCLFSEMIQDGVSYGIMEVSSHALELKRVNETNFDVVVFTNLSQDHLDFHINMENYKEAKGLLFGMAGKGKGDRLQYAVINKDESSHQYFMNKSQVPIYTYGINSKCDFQASNIDIKDHGVSYSLQFPKGCIDLELKITGLFNVYNSLAAFAVAYCEGIAPETIKARLETILGIPGRFEKINTANDFTVIVDYAHTPDSLENVLKSARKFILGRIITVFGCGGDRDRSKRPLMGETVAKYSDFSIVTSDNPRSEDPKLIIDDILSGLGNNKSPYEIILDRKEAIGKAIQMAKKGDLVLIAGKGHEAYQEVMGQTFPFDDREIAREFLKKLV